MVSVLIFRSVMQLNQHAGMRHSAFPGMNPWSPGITAAPALPSPSSGGPPPAVLSADPQHRVPPLSDHFPRWEPSYF